jgi:hypothetical protein
MRITPTLSAGRDLFNRWYFQNILPQHEHGFYQMFYTGTSTWEVATGFLLMDTGGTINSKNVIAVRSTETTILNWAKERRVEFWVGIWQCTAQDIYLISGDQGDNSCVGFYIVNNEIYGICGNYDSGERTSVLLDTFEEFHGSLSFVFMPASRVQFFVNGIYKGEVNTNLPTGSEDAYYLAEAQLMNTEAVEKTLNIYNILFLQRR